MKNRVAIFILAFMITAMAYGCGGKAVNENDGAVRRMKAMLYRRI